MGMRLRFGASVVLLAAALAAGCGDSEDGGAAEPSGGSAAAAPAQDTPQELRALYDEVKAKGQTRVVVYGPGAGPARPVWDAFEKEFPDIKVHQEDLFGPPLTNRLRAEYGRGKPQVDVISSGSTDLVAFADENWLEPYDPPTTEGLPDEHRGPDDLWTAPNLQVTGPAYNTNADIPEITSWKSLVDPSLKGKVSMGDATISSGTSQAIAAAEIEGILDDGWVQQLGSLGPRVFPSQANTIQPLASGELPVSVLVSYSVYEIAKADGAPIGFSFLEDGNYVQDNTIALAKDAPRPEVAKLLISWLFTPNGQKAAAEGPKWPGTMPDAPQVEGMEKLKPILLPYSSLEKIYPDSIQRNKRTLG
jgi:iron(III) transport system substrate-binding protein